MASYHSELSDQQLLVYLTVATIVGVIYEKIVLRFDVGPAKL